jgi:hypothetical protein
MNYSDTLGNDEERTVGPKGPSKSDPAQYKNGARAATTNRRGAGGTARHEHSALHYRGTACLQAAAQPSAVRIRSCAALPRPCRRRHRRPRPRTTCACGGGAGAGPARSGPPSPSRCSQPLCSSRSPATPP